MKQTKIITSKDTEIIAGDTVELLITVKTMDANGSIIDADVGNSEMFFLLSPKDYETTKVLQKKCEYVSDSVFKVVLDFSETEELEGLYTHQWILKTETGEKYKRTIGLLIVKKAIVFDEGEGGG